MTVDVEVMERDDGGFQKASGARHSCTAHWASTVTRSGGIRGRGSARRTDLPLVRRTVLVYRSAQGRNFGSCRRAFARLGMCARLFVGLEHRLPLPTGEVAPAAQPSRSCVMMQLLSDGDFPV